MTVTTRKIFLGMDIGSTKTRALLADESGAVIGSGAAGPGNHETVGFDGLTSAVHTALDQACARAHVELSDIHAAGFGIAGLDWDSQDAETRQAIFQTGLRCPLRLVNDAILGLLASASEGWGVAVVSGTGCNCWGWNKDHSRIGRVTGGGSLMGEGAGAAELMTEAVKAAARSWTKRGPATALADAFAAHAGARTLADLLSGLMDGRYRLEADAAPLIFAAAEEGDEVAAGLVEWAGSELGEMVNAVVRQLEFQALDFEVVEIGGMFAGGAALAEAMRRKVASLAPGARFVRLACPPAVGAVLLAMEHAGRVATIEVRGRLSREAAVQQ